MYTADVFCSSCTMIWVASCHNCQHCSLCLVTHRCTRVCHFSKPFTTHRPTSHFLQKYNKLHVWVISKHTQHCHCFPLEGQCCECFTCNWLSWDADGLGPPLEMSTAVTLSSCKWIINSQMRTSRKFLWVILPPRLADKKRVENRNVCYDKK
jgi:hypothetical protein